MPAYDENQFLRNDRNAFAHIDGILRVRPEPIQLRKSELPVEVPNIVPDIEDEAAVAASITGSPQTPSNHLEIEIGTVYRSRHDDSSGLWRVESFSKYTIVDKCLDRTATKLFDHAAPGRSFSFSTDRARPDALAVKEGRDRLGVLDRSSEDQGWPVWLNMCLISLDNAFGPLDTQGDTILHTLRKPGQPPPFLQFVRQVAGFDQPSQDIV